MKTIVAAASLAAVSLGLSLPVYAQPQSWFFVAGSDNGAKFFIDRSSISQTGDTASLRSLLVFSQMAEDGGVAAIVEEQYSCTERAGRRLTITFLYDDQSVRTAETLNQEWQPVQSGTVGEDILEIACSRPL